MNNKSNNQIIVALKARLESERKALAISHSKHPIQDNHAAVIYAHEAATERLFPLIEKMMSVIEFYGDKNTWLLNADNHFAPRIIAKDVSEIKDYAFSGGKKARDFLAEIEKEVENE